MKSNKEIKSIEYWLNSAISSFMVTKKEFYESCRDGFRLITFTDGSQKSYNK